MYAASFAVLASWQNPASPDDAATSVVGVVRLAVPRSGLGAGHAGFRTDTASIAASPAWSAGYPQASQAPGSLWKWAKPCAPGARATKLVGSAFGVPHAACPGGEDGQAGAPLFDGDGYVRAVLTGGDAAQDAWCEKEVDVGLAGLGNGWAVGRGTQPLQPVKGCAE